MANQGSGEAIEAELVDEIPYAPAGLATDRQGQAVAKLNAMIGGAVQRALDERATAEAAEKGKGESTPEARAPSTGNRSPRTHAAATRRIGVASRSGVPGERSRPGVLTPRRSSVRL